VSGAPARRSNALSFEVLPRVGGVALTTSATPASSTVTVTGQRLLGDDVCIKYGGVLIAKGKNTSTTQIQVTVDRILPNGAAVSVLVDGSESALFPPALERVAPTSASAGALVTLYGRGLSGTNVVAHLGATTDNLGPQQFSSQIQFTLPTGLAPGIVDVSLTIDGVDTGSVPLTVTA